MKRKGTFEPCSARMIPRPVGFRRLIVPLNAFSLGSSMYFVALRRNGDWEMEIGPICPFEQPAQITIWNGQQTRQILA